MAPNEDDLSEGGEDHESDEEGHEIGDINEEDDDDEDEDEVSKKYFKSIKSINEHNVTGTNFEKYNKERNKTTLECRRKIANFVLEYREMKGDREHAKAMLLEICEEAKIEKHMFVGYIL